jgi:chromosome segregation ATPase
MFKSLKLWNFQAHRHLEIEFAPGITTIKGPTDVGKSAVLRALRWVCLNDIGGEDFITWGQKEVVADLLLDSGRVSRRKGKENIYKLNGQPFRAIAAGKVPDAITVLLGVNEINFQRQLDAHFWLASSAPEVSRQLNRVIDLAVIDESLGKVAGFVRAARERVAVTEERLEEKRIALEAARLGTNRIKCFKVLSDQYHQYEKLEQDYHQLEGIITRSDSYQIGSLERKLSARAAMLAEGGKIWKAEREHSALRAVLGQLEAAKNRMAPLPDFETLAAAWDQLRLINRELLYSNNLDAQIIEATTRVADGERRYIAARTALAKNACPVCGRRNI